MSAAQCWARCGRPRTPPSAYCPPCAEANRREAEAEAAGRGPLLAGAAARCSVCRALFATVTDFDAHGPDRAGCGDPAGVGLVERAGVWGTAAGHTRRASDRERLAAVRNRRAAGPRLAVAGELGPRVHPGTPAVRRRL